MIDSLLAALGVDPRQFRPLLHAYLLMDLRRSGGLSRPGAAAGGGVRPFAGLLIIMLVTGAGLGAVTFTLRDSFTAAFLVVSYAGLNTALMLVIDFSGLAVSPDDFPVLASRPVSSRTYFAARMASLLTYVIGFNAAQALIPAVVLWAGHGLGAGGFLGTLAGAVLCGACAAVFVIASYTILVAHIHPRRVMRAASWLQLLSTSAALGWYYFLTQAFRGSAVSDFSLRGVAWVEATPLAWFAALVAVGAGRATMLEWIQASGAILLALVSVPVAAGRLSLEYAGRLAEVAASAEPAARARIALPGFGRDESRAIAVLLRAQFSYDVRFRLTVLAMLPMLGFYLLLGMDEGALMDPFIDAYRPGSTALWVGFVFLPIALHAAVVSSQNWRAAWIFFATPADPTRLIVATKNFVAVFFLGGYMLLLAIVWSFWYDRVWHAFVHATFIGLLGHIVLQLSTILKPALPLSAEPRAVGQSGQVLGLMLVGGISSGLMSLVLPLIYRRASRLEAFACLLLGVTVALEYVIHQRTRDVMSEFEWQ